MEVINKAYLDENLFKINGNLSLLEKKYYEFILNYNNQCVEENLIQTAVKTTIQILYDTSFFVNFLKAGEVLNDFVFVTSHRVASEKVNDLLQWFCS